MEFKGTKGEWELNNRKRGVEVNIKPSVYKQICTSAGNTKWQYDMLLISKAPEMLEMLNILVGNIERGPIKYTREEKLQMAQQLIKQATEL
ncbi:hypothetical protein ACKUSY_05850 [Myroides odoratus]